MALIVALLVGLVATPLSIRLAHAAGALDQPGALKLQVRAVPYLGGLAVFAAIGLPITRAHPMLLLPLGGALVLGTADDLGDLPVGLRLVAEVAIGLGVAAVEPVHGVAGVLWPVLLTVVLINAVNLLDGLDGMAAGVGIASALGFAVLVSGDARTLALALAGGLAALLVWNRPPARVYLGDGGSYLIGVTLAMLLTSAFVGPTSTAARSGALLLVAVPVADTTVALVRRFRAGRPLLQGDRGHVYDQLVDRGASTGAAALACVAALAALAGAAVGTAHLPTPAALAA
ncbi:MAG: UDP-N-acetylmuramyl pentapeptide phosphotransferase/UDP-N-acetylglucosamine-phosphate transferase, partial [Acidimicrobiales bacterium]|nr:UDP-N-acetylmuramyl pentapeptide phosphotransferase/UDP-N-acetylglucosamine-phosphate transferase [Acidimicrobiales bacterium]